MLGLSTLRFDPKKLRAAREAKELGLSEAAGLVGVSKQQLWNYEHPTGRGTPDPNVLLRLCTAYDVDLRELSNRRRAA
jgi:transcriptional regulator with XRE-family HTH domain